MTKDQYNAFCASLPATTHVVQWGNADVWKVGGKVFAIGGWQDEGNPHITFKTSPLAYDFLKDQPGCRPAPYLASRGMKWIQRTGSNTLTDDDMRAYIAMSHSIVAQGLSKRRRAELGLIKSNSTTP